MRRRLWKRAGPLIGAVVISGLILACLATPSDANIYATDLRWSAPAVDATQGSPSVDLSFRLNEPADQEVRIEIHRADNDLLVRTVNLGSRPKGLTTYSWNLRNDANQLVATNVEYYFKVFARTSGYGAWTLISDDNDTAVQFEYPRSVAVNKDPNNPNFGRIYVLQGRTAATVTGRPTEKGIYVLNADTTDALGQGNTAFTGGVPWTTSLVSPMNIQVGPDSKLYLFDWTDAHGSVWVAPSNPNGSWVSLLDPADVVNTAGLFSPGLPSPPAIHGSISNGLVVGKGLDRILYTVDEDIYVEGGHNVRGKGSVWRYPIGPLDKPFKEPGEVFYDDSTRYAIINMTSGIARDMQGNFFQTQYRSSGTDNPTLIKIAPDGNPTPIWESLATYGSPDPLRGNNSASVAVDDARNRIAIPSTERGIVNVLNTSLELSTLEQVGGGALVWAAGSSSKLIYSTNGVATTQTFTEQAAPEAGVQLNDINLGNTGTTLNGWAVGNGGKIFSLTNRVTWASEVSPIAQNLNGVAAIWNALGGASSVTHGWAVGDNGTILSNMLGSWVQETSPTGTKLNAISRRISSYAGPSYDLYVVGDGGLILRKLQAQNVDEPSAWETQDSGVTANLNSINMLVFALTSASTTGYAAGDSGTILKTTDGGATWTPQTSGTSAKLNGIYAVTGTNAWAVGNGGLILRTTDGQTWSPQTSGTTANLLAVEFRDVQTGWAVGESGVVLRTRNGGNTWQQVTVPGAAANLTGVVAQPTGAGSPRGIAFDAVGNLYETNNVTERLRIYSPPDGPNEYTTKSAFLFVPTSGDATKPAAPVVTAPPSTASASQLSASWTATGTAYRYAIGVTAEDQGIYVVPWTNIATTSTTRTGLSLINGVTYFWYVQARSANGVWSDVGVSGGTLVQAPNTIGEAKNLPNNALVTLQDIVVTKLTQDESFMNDGFFAQEQDQSAGVKINWTGTMPSANTLVTVVGTMGTSGPERVVNATSVTVGSAFTPTPLGVVGLTVGGSKTTGGSGLPNDGLLATVWGRVTGVDFGDVVFYIDDGSAVENDTPTFFVPNKVPGLKVQAQNVFPSEGQYLKVTGIIRLEDIGGGTVIRRLDVRDEFSDIEVVQ